MSEQPIHRPIGAEMERLRAKQQEEKKEHAGPAISRFFNYKHELQFSNPLRATSDIIKQMQAAGYLQQDVQVKINLRGQISRISDYFTRATVDPAISEGWWFEKDRICAGTQDEYRARRDTLTA